MEQYIPKSALVAEIKRIIKAVPRDVTDERLKAVYGNEYFILMKLLSFFDTLEVKEVQEEPCNSCQGFNDKDKCDELVFTHNCPIVKNPVSIWHVRKV